MYLRIPLNGDKEKGLQDSRNKEDMRKESTEEVDTSFQNQAVTEIPLRDTSSQTWGGRRAGMAAALPLQ